MSLSSLSHRRGKELNEDTFIRDMPPLLEKKLAAKLDIENMWEHLAIQIPRRPDAIFNFQPEDPGFEPKYTTQGLAALARKGQQRGGSSTRSILTDWGMQNSQVKHLIVALMRARLFEAAKFIQDKLPQNTCQLQQQENRTQGTCPQLNSLGDCSQFNAIGANSQRTTPNTVTEGGHNESSLTQSTVVNQLPRNISLLPNNFVRQSVVPFDSGLDDSVSLPQSFKENKPQCEYDAMSQSERMSVYSGADKGGSVGQAPSEIGTLNSPTGTLSSPTDTLKSPTDFLNSPIGTPNSPDINYPQMPDFSSLHRIEFSILKKITNNFDSRHFREGGRLIGEGGFGDVFLGTFHSDYKVAIKRLKQTTEDSIEQFRTEVETLSRFKHENLVLLMGYSIEAECNCLIYQYMACGSLEERLACRFNTPPLSAAMRLEIVRGTACGIAFLNDGGLVHRDIKSANILLDEEFKPKVGDFATARVLSESLGEKTFQLHTSKVIGTASYIAPEALNFVITPKLDSFSFGVVLLEILTGLPVLDHSRKEIDLKVLVQEHCYQGEEEDEEDEPAGTIFDLLDKRAGTWDEQLVKGLYALSCQCLEHEQRIRPTIKQILPDLENLSPNSIEALRSEVN